jgi:putative flippase GtrA
MTVVKYIIFAILSIIVNILCQYVILNIYNGFLDLYVALFIGTLVGFFLKFSLDKIYIFHYENKKRGGDIKDFMQYVFVGICITLIFWTLEIGLDYLFKNELAKYIGGIFGLVVGYTIKYFLDKKYIFINKE